MTVQVQDWRACAVDEITALVAREARAWRTDLDWDVTEAWRVLEPARRAGRLPGIVVRDTGGRPSGWGTFLLHRDCLQVLALVAANQASASALVEAVRASREAALATTAVLCVRDGSPGLAGVLASHGFEVETYRYLSAAAGAAGDDASLLQPWAHHEHAMADLCARAYADSDGIRAFAPGGTMEEWRDYLHGLLSSPGCGWVAPGMSFVAAGPAGARLDGAVLVTTIAAGVAHVAQVAVDPSARGRGLGRRLVRAAMQAAGARGCSRVTLLVSTANRPAAALYESLGFSDQARFVVATKAQPSSSTSLALTTGGESTRR